MVVDHLSNLSKYTFLNSNITKAIDFIAQNNLLNLPSGKTTIDGTEVFILRDTYQAKPLNECFFEGHLKYLDIQIVLKGSEYIGYSNKNNQNIFVTDSYNAEKDIAKYQIKDFTRVHLYEGMFAIFFPEDLHMPKLEKEPNCMIEKVVFKIKLQEIKE